MPAAELEIAGGTAAATKDAMLYMVIERFKADPALIYQRLRERGRMMPVGLDYVSSWINLDLKICYQLMQTKDESLFALWTQNWKDLMEFEIVPVRTSAETTKIVASPA